MAKKAPHKTQLLLENTSVDPNFALATTIDPVTLLPVPNPAFTTLTAKLGTLPGGPYDYAYVSMKGSSPGKIDIGTSLESLSGVIATGNGKDTIDLSGSTGNNLVLSGNGKDLITGGDGNDIINAGNGKDRLDGGADTGTFSNAIDPITGLPVLSFIAGDVLTGGNSPDTFVFNFGDGVDQITDFKMKQDHIEFGGITLDQLVSMTDGSDLYIGINDGAGGWLADSAIRIDGLTDFNAILNSQGFLFV